MVDYESPIILDGGTSFLNLILLNRKWENLCAVFLNKLLVIADYCPHVLNYIITLPPPNLLYGKWTDWIRPFILEFNADTDKM